MLTRGRVRVALTKAHLDESGRPNHAAERLVWEAAAGIPDGCELVLDLGAARHVNHKLLSICGDELGPRSCLVIEGRTPGVVQAHIDACRVTS